MNRTRPFLSTLTGAAGCLAAVALASPAQAQQRPTVRPVVALAAASPIPTEPTSTPAPDAAAEEKSPPTDDPDKNELTETDIDASEGASFNSKDRVAVFIKDVKVTDPRFQLVCDKLTVFLNKTAPAGQNAAATPAPTPPPVAPTGKAAKGKAQDTPPGGTDAGLSGGGGIDHALAEGHVVILQKKAATKPGEEEKVSIGRGESGTFDNKSGDMVLRGWPSLEQNGSSLIATSAGTVMTIHRDSSLDTKGPSKTKLIQHGKGGGGSLFEMPGAPSAPAAPHGGGGHNHPHGGAPVAATPAAR